VSAYRNRLLEMVDQGIVPLGMQCFTGNAALIEVLGLTGYDFVMLDTEHSPNNPRALEDSIRAANHVNMVPVVRVPSFDDETSIRRALEAGAEGIFLPMVKSAADIRTAADAAFFPPLGKRGICPSVRATGYAFNDFNEYARRNNESTILVPLIEHPDAVENIEEICALPEVSMVIFGVGDLSFAMGEGVEQLRSPKVQAAYRRVMDAAAKYDVPVVGGPNLDPTPETCLDALEMGVKVFTLGLDIMAFRRACEGMVNDLYTASQKSELSRPTPPPSGFPTR